MFKLWHKTHLLTNEFLVTLWSFSKFDKYSEPVSLFNILDLKASTFNTLTPHVQVASSFFPCNS